ncbi:MAG: metallophosphoesterase family protein [Actinomycetes bacterium]
MRVAVLSDTHSPRRWKGCPPAVAKRLARADAILHAGDVCLAATLDELATFAPVHVVVGNNDEAAVAGRAPETLQLELAGLQIAMIHDSGRAHGRAARLRARFPDAALVVFGHSHVPLNEVHHGQRLLNPGSPTDRRRQPQGTMGEVTIKDGRLVSARIVAVT